MNEKLIIAAKFFLVSILFTGSISASARVRQTWHRGDIHHFEAHDRAIWIGGHWRHVRYDGRLGWWWVVGPSWYFYTRPIYPYPDPYIPPVVIVQPQSAPNPPAASPPVQNWYFCPDSKEYYPYVSTCPGGWKAVPVTPKND